MKVRANLSEKIRSIPCKNFKTLVCIWFKSHHVTYLSMLGYEVAGGLLIGWAQLVVNMV